MREQLSIKKRAARQSKSKIFTSREFYAKRRRLKELGILVKRTDLRKAPTKHQRKLIREYADLLAGRAAVIEAPSAKAARVAAGPLRRVGNKIIVPKAKGDRIRYRNGQIEVKAKIYGANVTRRPVYEVFESGARKPIGDDIQYAIDFHRGSHSPETYRFKTWKELSDFMDRYSHRKRDPWRDWRKYAWIETLVRK